jgi:hypothetical protein
LLKLANYNVPSRLGETLEFFEAGAFMIQATLN